MVDHLWLFQLLLSGLDRGLGNMGEERPDLRTLPAGQELRGGSKVG